jgi:exodeoxyribonuclease VII small subunit
MTPSTPENGKTLSFEEMLAELESVVHDLEAGDVSLEQALARYERGVTLLKQCYGQLQSAEQKIFLLNGESADGKPITQPFDHTSADPRRRASKAESQ